MGLKAKSNKVHVEDENNPAAWKEKNTQDRVTIRQLLRPSLISMALSGCYTYDANLVKTGSVTSKGRPYRIFGTMYRILYFLICIAACVKSAATFATVSSTFLQLNVIKFGWYIQCLIFFLIFLKSNHTKYGGQRKAFDFVDEKIMSEMKTLGLEFPEKKIKKRQKIYLTIAATVSAVGVAGNVIASTDQFTYGFSAFFAAPFQESIVMVFLENFFFMALTLIWIIPMFYIIVVSTMLVSTFEVFNKFLEKHIEQNSATMTNQFQRIRQLHLNLCKMVSHLDQDFGYYFAVIFVFSVGLSCFLLYLILKSQPAILVLVIFLFWLISILSLLGTISVFAAFVNEAVSTIWCSIKRICVFRVTC